MEQFLQVLLSGLATGSIYALVAIGFTLLWQAAQTVNFAQGEFVMLPAFFVLTRTGWVDHLSGARRTWTRVRPFPASVVPHRRAGEDPWW